MAQNVQLKPENCAFECDKGWKRCMNFKENYKINDKGLDLKRAQGIRISKMTKNKQKNNWLTPAEMAQKTGVSVETLHYYEREGLIQNVSRNVSGHRRYSGEDLHWIEVLRCLRETGMTMQQLRTYCQLGEQGDHTRIERLELLHSHRQKVIQSIESMHKSLALVDHKIQFYKDALKQEVENEH